MEHLLGLGQTSRMSSYLHKNLQRDYDSERDQIRVPAARYFKNMFRQDGTPTTGTLVILYQQFQIRVFAVEGRSHYPFGEAVIWNDFPSAVTV